MTAHGEVIGLGAIRFERLLPGPIERVWDYLVKPELRRTWLADGAMDLRVGGEIEMIWHNEEIGDTSQPAPEPLLGLSGYRCTGVVTACEAPRLIAFTWDEKGVSSEVRIELTQLEAAPGQRSVRTRPAVKLVLTHTRLKSRGSAQGTATGWHTHLDFLGAVLEGRAELPSYWSIHERYAREYEDRLGADSFLAPEGHGLLAALPGGGWKLQFERRFGSPISEVWAAITEPKHLDAWYPAELRFDRIAGGNLTETFRAEDGSETGVVQGRVTAFEPQRLFAFEMAGDPSSEYGVLQRPQSISIELQETLGEAAGESGKATLLTFSHCFEDPSQALSVAPGWHHCLEWLARSLEERADTSPEHVERLKEFYRRWLERA